MPNQRIKIPIFLTAPVRSGIISLPLLLKFGISQKKNIFHLKINIAQALLSSTF